MRNHRLLFALFVVVTFALKAQSISRADIQQRLVLNKAQFDNFDRGTDLLKKVASTNRDVSITKKRYDDPVVCIGCPEPDPANHPDVRAVTRESDLVVIGKVVSTLSSLTNNHCFVFTDSEFVIQEIWKNGTKQSTQNPIRAGSEITVVSPGGVVNASGHKITVEVSWSSPLIVGHQYLLYLKYLPASESYSAAGFEGFDITAPLVSSRYEFQSPMPNRMHDRASFLQSMRNSTLREMQDGGK